MRIVLDANGSDNAPVPDVAGAVLAAREFGDTIILTGDESQLRQELAKHDTRGLNIEIVHASQRVEMTDKPGVVGKAKQDSSMHVGMNLVRDGKADAFVTAGNTGAALSIATLFTLKRIPGIKRPTLSAIVNVKSIKVMISDVGANADAKADWLQQFAIMSSAYAQAVFGNPKPRIALLSNGEEEGKGNELIHEAEKLLRDTPINFVGNIEPTEISQNKVDVIICDGFVGNILLKSLEGTSRMVVNLLREEIMSSTVTKLAGLLLKPVFGRIRKYIDPNEVGGAPLLGVNGVVIIGHGSSNPVGIKNAIGQARRAVQGNLIETIKAGIEQVEKQP